MTCPICQKPSAPPHKPFCSRRCADIDLGRWLTSSYALPARADEEDENPEEASASAQYKQPPEPKPHQ